MNENSASMAPPIQKKYNARDWRDIYAGRLVITDLLVLIWVVFGVQIAWLGFDSQALGISGSSGEIAVNYTMISILVIAGWMAALSLYDSRADRVVGVGSLEYKAIANASLRLFGVIAIVSFLLKIDLARGYILIAFPLGVLVLLFSRWMWRQWLNVQRQNGSFCSTVVLVGSEASVDEISRDLRRFPAAGYRVVGACLPDGIRGSLSAGSHIPIAGNLDDIMVALEETLADTVVVTSSGELSTLQIRQLSWGLEPGRQHLVVAPGLTGLGGPRIHTRPVAGLPLIHVEIPRYEGSKSAMKRGFDVVLSGALIVLFSPLLAITAIAIRLGGPGDVLFRQRRVGIRGDTFEMLKFRSMVTGAESLLGALDDETSPAGNTIMFKMKDDPRVTRLGRFLRRFSLDELPQIVNVLKGDMSLVGPRPPLEREVDLYETHVHRRFLVKPGITGLWQVSGRSNLSWEDTVRLDLYYVENWSITGDLVILWRTARAVIARDGAY